MEWISVKDRSPLEDGRYLVLVDFIYPCISNDSIVRKSVAFVSNFKAEEGWISKTGEDVVTHWMKIPPLTNPIEEDWGNPITP